jgi:hypothetical protein
VSETHTSSEDHYEPGVYETRIKGRLADRWADWFGGLTITLEDSGDTLLTGPVVDQAALHGLLKKVCDLGMPLLSVNRVEPGQADANEPYQYRSTKEEIDDEEFTEDGRHWRRRRPSSGLSGPP